MVLEMVAASFAVEMWRDDRRWPTLAATTSKLKAELETDWPVSFQLPL